MRALVALLCITSLLSPIANAEEDAADCEEGQPWLLPERRGAQPTFDAAEDAAGADLSLCEGEQWDGQDPVADEPASCSGTIRPAEPYFLGICMGPDPNTMPTSDVANPFGARVASDGSNEAYAAANVALVSMAAVYIGTCGEGENGLEGDAACGGSREARAGLYLRDNTPGNLLASQAPSCSMTIHGCHGNENDCDHEIYRWQQELGQSICRRDNTAFGVGIVLP